MCVFLVWSFILFSVFGKPTIDLFSLLYDDSTYNQCERIVHSIAGSIILQTTPEDAGNPQFFCSWQVRWQGRGWTTRRFDVQHHRQSVAMKTCSNLLHGMSGMESKRLAAALADEIDVVGGWLGGSLLRCHCWRLTPRVDSVPGSETCWRLLHLLTSQELQIALFEKEPTRIRSSLLFSYWDSTRVAVRGESTVLFEETKQCFAKLSGLNTADAGCRRSRRCGDSSRYTLVCNE